MSVFRAFSPFFLSLIAVASMGQFTAPKPGPEHERLKELVGNWDLVMTVPQGGGEISGSVVYESACDGLWIVSDLKMNFEGAPFQGKGIDGYDSAKKKYVSVWVDNMISYPMIFEGNYDPAKKQLEMLCNAPGPDGKPIKWRSITTFIDRDHHSFEMFQTPQGGTESMVMRIDYTRKK